MKHRIRSLFFALLLVPLFAAGLGSCSSAAPVSLLLNEGSFPSSGLYRMPARPDKGFYWPYFLYVPQDMEPDARLLVIGPNNIVSSDLSKLEGVLRSRFTWIVPGLSEPLRAPVLVPAFIRPPTRDAARDLYTHALTRATLTTSEPSLRRVDLQTLAMVDDAFVRFASQGNALRDNRILLNGFSAAADFAQRMAVLHPERVVSVAVGGIGAMPTLPIAALKGVDLTYPVGVADLRQITGQGFDAAAFRKTPLLIIHGSRDNNDSIGYLDSYTTDQSHLVQQAFGNKPINRVDRVTQVFSDFGMDRFELRVHRGVGHRATQRYYDEVVDWLRSSNQ